MELGIKKGRRHRGIVISSIKVFVMFFLDEACMNVPYHLFSSFVLLN
jgi:hypothetical protein